MKKKNLSLFTSRTILGLFMLIAFSLNSIAQTDSTAVKAKKQKYTGPMPCAAVNSHNGSLVPVGTYVFINKYFNITRDQLYSGTEEMDFPTTPGSRAFYYEELQTALRTGIIKGVDARLIMSFFEKKLDRLTPSSDITDINGGIGDMKLFVRYGVLSQKTSPINLIVGIGSTIPLGSTDAEDNAGNVLPGSMQLGSGSWNPLFELGVHKVKKRQWMSGYFMYMYAMDGELGPNVFTRSNVLKYNFAYAYAITKMFDLGAEINSEMLTKAKLNDVELDNTGGHVVQFTPEIHFKFAKGMHLDISLPIPIYQDLNGPQFGYTSSIVGKLAMKF